MSGWCSYFSFISCFGDLIIYFLLPLQLMESDQMQSMLEWFVFMWHSKENTYIKLSFYNKIYVVQ